MEDIVQRFTASFVTDFGEQPYDNLAHTHLFKNNGREATQEKRRRQLLMHQKHCRIKKVDKTRGILEMVEAIEAEMEDDTSMTRYRPTSYVAGFQQRPSYSNTLMFSEWLVERPDDFEEKWYLVPCPKGKRVLVVAVKNRTKSYSKFGTFLSQWQSPLPGGHHANTKQGLCVLDCVFDEALNTMHVLDLLVWNNQSMTDCEAEFRHYWLVTKFAENEKLTDKSNKIKFTIIPKYPCTKDNITRFMSTYPVFPDDQPKLDGILFYHKEAHYTAGSTPLVGWLFPFMINEVLGEDIAVDPRFMKGKPNNYTTQVEYIEKFDDKQNQIKKYQQRFRFNSTSSNNTSIVQNSSDENEKGKSKKTKRKKKKGKDSMDVEVAAVEGEIDTKNEEEMVTSNDLAEVTYDKESNTTNIEME